MKTSLLPLQKMFIDTLRADTALMDKITGIYDDVSKKAIKPYVTIGEPNVTPFDTKTSTGENIIWTLHCWSSYKGKKETYEILNLILQAMSKSPLTVDGFTLFRMEIVNMNVITDIDGETRHGILQLRLYVND
ncbi:DUF3168 domain-containing protein [Ornithinibacillus xuwenensis]|uniref:DUF3168 domain-containing protein n=1 Tax=Ornithinibacillus xuwenensis TaxID=3144668 RepID=A0ABU9XC50_9BACI